MFDLKPLFGFGLALVWFCSPVLAQDSGADLNADAVQQKNEQTGGFLPILQRNPSSAEIDQQEDLWILDVAFKPMRMIPLQMTNPKTGEKERQTVWYLVYKIRNTPVDRPADAANQVPINIEDDRRIGNIFVPEFELVTHDNDQTRSYRDVIHPEAVALIAKRERLPLKSSIAISGDLGKVGTDEFQYGVAIWTDVDPNTDFFTLYVSGFSSAYRINPENKVLQKRTIVMEYARPGDEYEEVEREFRPQNDPVWIYRPTEVKVDQTASK
ncbi:hypothetical protein Pla110_31690 [Polystyrenella longa]|uniref:Uncharacterized protein n=1 Tax=Polystyrenella longa TaxID=2528007 RepID=A0A518CQC3_9PLAN|nr:hypothetical protein [Polystyrenella longa]QDU81428.1 hypothetical protein Pla110_31690 [Polystyrenella longa]